jgi:hypothetical protein
MMQLSLFKEEEIPQPPKPKGRNGGSGNPIVFHDYESFVAKFTDNPKTTGTQKLSDWNAKYNVKGARVNLYLGKRFRNLFQDLKISETAKNAIGVEDEDAVNPEP